MSARTILSTIALTGALGVALAGCSTGPNTAEGNGAESDTVTLIVHDSFPNDEFAAAASEATGYDVEVLAAGDGGELTNQLVLTKGEPLADAFFGVDTIFASRLIENEVVEPYAPAGLPDSALDFAVTTAATGDERTRATVEATGLVPVDHGSTCLNIDATWFEAEGVAEPETYEDLLKPEYEGLTVLLDPAASSTGGSFLVGTVAEFGEDGYVDYWQGLIDNGARVEQGWSDAYYGQFTQGGEGGTFPIVVSYASSPAFTANDDLTESSTKALLDTCTRQVEYAGVLAGAANPEGAQAVVDYLVSHEFQLTIPEAMYMAPVDDSAPLPEANAKFGPEPAPGTTHDLTAEQIEQGREAWLRALDEVLSR